MRFQKTSLPVKLVILALVVCATVTLISLQSQIQQVKAENVEKQQQISAITQNNEKLKAVNDDLTAYQQAYDSAYQAALAGQAPAPTDEEDEGEEAEDVQAVDPAQVVAGIDSDAMDAAAREQGYVDPGEIIFEDINS